MIASITNFAKLAVLTATPASALQDINVVTDGDYSSVYVDTLAGEVKIEFVFPVNMDIGYIALGGTNIAKKDSIKITASSEPEPIFWQTVSSEQLVSTDPFDLTVSLGGTVDDTDLGFIESSVMMYKVDIANARRITMVIKGTGKISIAEIAIGDYYEIPRGEQGGYRRPWTVPNIKARSSVGLDNSPVNLSYESRSLKCTLTVPNNVMRDFDGWYNFINFAANNTFYILEDLDKFHSYAGFNAVPAMTGAHGQTRSLGVSAITFNAFAKSTEALF
jgi:hypothetical protein